MPVSFDATDAWDIPLDTSYQEVGDGDCAREWVADYPELVLIAFSFQYVRASVIERNDDVTANLMPRVKIQIAVDGVPQSGTGPYNRGADGSVYGSGMQERSCAQTVMCMVMLPAGYHRVSPVAAQGPATYAEGEDQVALGFGGDDSGCQICNRKMIVFRFPKGEWMGA